jgi:hypothetical protein
MQKDLISAFVTYSATQHLMFSDINGLMGNDELKIWFTDSGMIASSTEQQWPLNDNGIPLIGVTILKVNLLPESVTANLIAAPDSGEARRQNQDVLTRNVHNAVFTEVARYIERNPELITKNLTYAALSQIKETKQILNQIKKPTETTHDRAFH